MDRQVLDLEQHRSCRGRRSSCQRRQALASPAPRSASGGRTGRGRRAPRRRSADGSGSRAADRQAMAAGPGSRAAARAAAPRPAASRSGLGCRDAAARRSSAALGGRARRSGRRTSRRSHRRSRATTPRSWVIRMIASPARSRRSRSRRRICACTVTSRAVVGSSAISSSGGRRAPIGDHRALAHAAGELVRIGPDASAPGRECRPDATDPRPARAHRLAATMPWWKRSGFGDLLADRSSPDRDGSSGSERSCRSCAPRTRRICDSRARASRSRPSRLDARRRRCARAGSAGAASARGRSRSCRSRSRRPGPAPRRRPSAKETPSTARTVPPGVANSTVRSSTSKQRRAHSPHARASRPGRPRAG